MVRSEILELFGITLTAEHMYSSHNWKKVPQQVETLLSEQAKKFSEIFIAILESIENFGHFETKDTIHSLNILDVIDLEKRGYLNAQKLLF